MKPKMQVEERKMLKTLHTGLAMCHETQASNLGDGQYVSITSFNYCVY